MALAQRQSTHLFHEMVIQQAGAHRPLVVSVDSLFPTLIIRHYGCCYRGG